MYFNPLSPAAGNRLLPLSAHASLLWAGVTASPGSDLRQPLPHQLQQTDPMSIKSHQPDRRR